MPQRLYHFINIFLVGFSCGITVPNWICFDILIKVIDARKVLRRIPAYPPSQLLVVEPMPIELEAGFGVDSPAGIQKLVSESSGPSGLFPRRNSSWLRPLRYGHGVP